MKSLHPYLSHLMRQGRGSLCRWFSVVPLYLSALRACFTENGGITLLPGLATLVLMVGLWWLGESVDNPQLELIEPLCLSCVADGDDPPPVIAWQKSISIPAGSRSQVTIAIRCTAEKEK